MWSMIKVVKCDIDRTLFNVSFMAAVLVTFLLCFSENIYVDGATMQTYSVLEVLLSFDRAFMERNFSLCSITVLRSAFSGYSAMFLPIVASFPFVYSQNAERNSGNIRFLIFRTKRRKYYVSKCICAVLSGGSCIMLGVLLFGVFSFAAFPQMADYTTLAPEFNAYTDVFAEIIKKFFSVFIYGCVNTVFAFFLSSFCRNRYLVLCIPFLMRFMQDTMTKKIIVNAADDNIYQIIFPFTCYAPSQIPYLETGYMLYSTVAVLAVFMALMLFGYIMIMERRTDKGE